MKSSLCNILLCLILCHYFHAVSARRRPLSSTSTKSTTPLKSSSRWDRYLERVFQEADENHDGSISFEETYERVLLFYIRLNQKAPIPPPSKAKVKTLYQQADWSRNRKLNKSEFKALASTLAARGYTRLLAHKFVTVVIAPIVANYVVNYLAHSTKCARLRNSCSSVLHRKVERADKIINMLESVEFWKTLITILAVTQLGNLVLFFVNWWFNTSKSVIIENEKGKAITQ